MRPDPALLLSWYDRHRRVMPWRDQGRDPYHIWLSEVMLQQTTVATVGPRFRRFLTKFPTVAALAAASAPEVMEEWAGLGYYARARNLHAGAKAVVALGGFPRSVAGLRGLPGVGAYTAAAVAAIAFDLPVVPLDGNVERVMARVHAVRDALPGAKPRLAALAQDSMADAAARARPGDFVQALFDLGATICTPRTPACALCPWRGACAAQTGGFAAALPVRAPKRDRPLRHGSHFLLRDAAGFALVRRRPPKGLLGGMLEFPGTSWRETPWSTAEALALAPVSGLAWQLVPGVAEHSFTHFALEMALFTATVPHLLAPDGMEARPLARLAATLPTAMRRLLELAKRWPASAAAISAGDGGGLIR